MKNYNDELNQLFDEWIKQSVENNEQRENTADKKIIFTYDGLMEKPKDKSINIEESWDKAPKRIMFLLKDQPTQWSDDSRLWLKTSQDESEHNKKIKEENCQLKSRFLHNIADLFYGVLNADKNNDVTYESLDYNKVKDTFLTYPFAFVECKKQGGTTSITNKELRHYLDTYKDLLYQEISILKPNIIICTNNYIYKFVIDYFGENNLVKLEDPRHNSIRIDPKNKIIVLNSYHPKLRKSNIVFYDGVMDHYRAFLHSKYAF